MTYTGGDVRAQTAGEYDRDDQSDPTLSYAQNQRVNLVLILIRW